MKLKLVWQKYAYWQLVITVLLLSTSRLALSDAQPTLETVEFQINDTRLTAEIADDSQKRLRGLSFRKSLALNAGMLFVYSQEQKLLFTMQDASIPLSIAFLDNEMNILEILAMTPFTKGPYPSAFPARFALEMNQGWFKQNNVKPGDKLQKVQ